MTSIRVFRESRRILRRLMLGSALESNYIGEDVSKAAHMIQAGLTARSERHPDEVVLACLLHDIGHLLAEDDTNGYGVSDHARLGAAFLRGLALPERTCRAVELHADAKRYIVGQDCTYPLTHASRQTLAFQGGPMTLSERLDFEKDPAYADALLVRGVDDRAKTEDMPHSVVATLFDGFFVCNGQ